MRQPAVARHSRELQGDRSPGKPIAFYSNKLSIFRVNAKDAAGGDGTTQFGRALSERNIDILCANSPRAKSLPVR
jgi:hypothetical protein